MGLPMPDQQPALLTTRRTMHVNGLKQQHLFFSSVASSDENPLAQKSPPQRPSHPVFRWVGSKASNWTEVP